MFDEYDNIEDFGDEFDSHFEAFTDFPGESNEPNEPKRPRKEWKSKGDLEYGDEPDSPENPEEPKSKKIKKIKQRNENRPDYVNEHALAMSMAMFKNWDGHLPKSIVFEEPWKTQRAKYTIARAKYDSLLKSGLDKRNQEVQKAFLEALELSTGVFPTDNEVGELYFMMRSICSGCIPTYGRNYNLDIDDVVGITFERWIKYRHNYDPFKKSEISGTRVNAFAYMTQVIKNTIYELVNKANTKAALEEKLRGEIQLYESYNPSEAGKNPEVNESGESEESKGKDYISKDSVETKEYTDSQIIKIIMERVPYHNEIVTLILEIESLGYTRDEIFSCIGEYSLLEPLEDVLVKNKWANF